MLGSESSSSGAGSSEVSEVSAEPREIRAKAKTDPGENPKHVQFDFELVAFDIQH